MDVPHSIRVLRVWDWGNVLWVIIVIAIVVRGALMRIKGKDLRQETRDWRSEIRRNGYAIAVETGD